MKLDTQAKVPLKELFVLEHPARTPSGAVSLDFINRTRFCWSESRNPCIHGRYLQLLAPPILSHEVLHRSLKVGLVQDLVVRLSLHRTACEVSALSSLKGHDCRTTVNESPQNLRSCRFRCFPFRFPGLGHFERVHAKIYLSIGKVGGRAESLLWETPFQPWGVPQFRNTYCRWLQNPFRTTLEPWEAIVCWY